MIFMDPSGSIKKKRCKEVDFVFVYEVKNREIQGIALVGYELIKRGYTVGYVNTWHGLHHDDIRYRAKVAVVFEAYNTDVIGFALSFIEHCDNVYNMQWEQILCDDCLKEDSIYILKGDAKKVYHAAWGIKNKEHLIRVCNIPQENVNVVGNVSFDFVRSQFEGFYKTKKEICSEYDIKYEKKIVIFLSSFGFSDAPQYAELNELKKKSQKTIIEWLIQYASEFNEMSVIYRPHPTELLDDDTYKRIQDGNIYIIKDYSVQQWITISDVILNWWSTSLGDVYAAKRKCVFIRPYPVPEKYEYYLFKTIKKATSYGEMIRFIEKDEELLTREEYEKYYSIDDKKLTFVRIGDQLESILKEKPQYLYDNKHRRRFKEKSGIIEVREYYGYVKSYIRYLLGMKNDYKEIKYHLTMSKEFFVAEKSIIHIMKRIGKFV